MKELRTEIEISTNADKVWKILSDFDKYHQWNPFINRIIGQAKEGSKIEIHIETPGGKNRKYQPIVTKIEQGRELRWLGKSLDTDVRMGFEEMNKALKERAESTII